MISAAFLLAGLFVGVGLFDFLVWRIIAKKKGKSYELLYVSVLKAMRREANRWWSGLGETPERKTLTVMVAIAGWFLRYVVLQYLNALSGLLTLSFVLFFWPINVNPFTRGIVFGLAILTHLVWIIGRFNRWIDADESTRAIVLFLWRIPWQLCGGVTFALWLLSAISVSGDTGLIDTGMGYSLHPLSFVIPPLIMVGLYLGDEFGTILGNLWIGSKDEREEVKPAEPVISLIESA